MQIEYSFGQEFDKLWSRLKAKYPQALFDIEGIGKQLDSCEFARDFFGNSITADSSIDPNANVEDNSIIVYNTESDKPSKKLNSIYVLWHELKNLYGKHTADTIIEMQIAGDIYIHDLHGISAGMPYSYHRQTSIVVKVNENIYYMSMEDLFDKYKDRVNTLNDREEIRFKSNEIQILDRDVFIELNVVLRHKTDKKLIELETKNGMCTIVTEDHPVIMNEGEKYASDITLNDNMMESMTNVPITGTLNKSLNEAYITGFMLGDGWSVITKGKTKNRRGALSIRQNNIIGTKIYDLVSDTYDNVSIIKNGTQINFGYLKDAEEYRGKYGQYSQNVKLPNDILMWGEQSIKSLISGLIDSDGSINTNGVVSIRVSSYQLVQQIAEMLRSMHCGKIRTSFIGKYSSKNSFKSNLELYRLSIRLTDRDFINLSEKIKSKQDLVYKPIKTDGRFETNKLHKIKEYEGEEEWVYDVTTETGHFHCNGLVQHNCFNYSCYDLVTQGLSIVTKIDCIAPKYFTSFKSQLEQFTVIASNSTLGATGLADMLVCMSWYVKKMLDTLSDEHFHFASEEDVWFYTKANLVSLVYTLNQPMRANQSPFTNVSIYDDEFLDALLPDYLFPDGSTPDKEIVKKLQVMFLDCMNEELRRNPLTFPVTTACHSVDKNGNLLDSDFLKMIAEKNMEFAFINIYCGDSSTISSCCRLRSEGKNEYFNSFGSGSTKIGSLGVCSINFPRLAYREKDIDKFLAQLKLLVRVSAQVNNAKREVVRKRIENGNEPLYTLGFMSLSNQYSTTGVNGLNECIEILGYDILEESGTNLSMKLIDTINKENDKYQALYKAPHNCEQVPGETMSVKMAKKDMLMGLNMGEYQLYSNQFIPLTTNADMLDRLKLQGIFDKHFSGGSICHLNVENRVEDVQHMIDLIVASASMGVIYFAINYNLQRCEEGHMTVANINNKVCSICGKKITDNFTRVVG